MQTQKATLETPKINYTLDTPNIDKDSLYFVDWQNLKGVEDLVLIFACMGLSFSGHHPHFETIKHLLDLSNPVKTNQPAPPQPKAEDLKLPKMKQVK
jgi:hypothetical protein